MLTGFQYISGQKKTVYYSPENGHMLYGLQTIEGNQYFFNLRTGARTSGLVTLSSPERIMFFSDTGVMVTGQKKVNGYWYYFDESTGAAVTGWKDIPEKSKRVYYDSQGHMLYGQQKRSEENGII